MATASNLIGVLETKNSSTKYRSNYEDLVKN